MVGKLLGDEAPESPTFFEANVRQERDRRRQTRTRTLQQTSFALEAGTNWKNATANPRFVNCKPSVTNRLLP